MNSAAPPTLPGNLVSGSECNGSRPGAIASELCRNLGDASLSSSAICGVVSGDTIGECDAFDDHWQLFRALQTAPCLGGGLNELEDHEFRGVA